MNAESFIKTLKSLHSDDELNKNRSHFVQDKAHPTIFLGVKIKAILDLAKTYKEMGLKELGILLANPYYEVRLGAVAIMALQAQDSNSTDELRHKLMLLYMEKHDRINNWDLVDRAAPHVIGRNLFDKERALLFDMAASSNVWERRSAIVATLGFVERGELDDTFAIAQILLGDGSEHLQKAIGTCLREAGKHNEKRLIDFIQANKDKMHKQALFYAVGHMSKEKRNLLLSTKK